MNAGNETLDGGGGIYKAIHETEKQRLLTECWELNDWEISEFKVTLGYKLPDNYLFHTLRPTYKNERKLSDCCRSCFQKVLACDKKDDCIVNMKNNEISKELCQKLSAWQICSSPESPGKGISRKVDFNVKRSMYSVRSHKSWENASFLVPTLFLLYINDLDDVICDIAIYADDTTLYLKCDQTSYLWQQLEMASELESDLRDTMDWGRKCLVDFNAGKTQLVWFDQSSNTGAIDAKMNGFLLLRCWGWLSLLNWIGALIISPLLKLPPRKLEP